MEKEHRGGGARKKRKKRSSSLVYISKDPYPKEMGTGVGGGETVPVGTRALKTRIIEKESCRGQELFKLVCR